MIFKKMKMSIYTCKNTFVRKEGIRKYICTSLFIHEEIKKYVKDKLETNTSYFHWDRCIQSRKNRNNRD